MVARSSSPLRDDELLIQREFDAPVALVFRLWESPDHMIRWWGPEQFTTTYIDWKLLPGRPWSATMVSRAYGVSNMGGVIQEVEKNRRIVFSFAWDKDTGFDMDTVVTVTFAEVNGKTLQTFHQTPFSSVAQRDSHVGGWNSLFNKQQTYAENFAIAKQKGART